jgi:ABC-2 type transport system permease protein
MTKNRYLASALTVTWRHLRIVSRAPGLWIPPLIFPLFFYTAFAGGISAVGNVPGFDYPNYNTFQFAFVLLQSAAFGGVFIGFALGADFDRGIARRLFLSTRHRSAIILGYGLAAFVRALAVWAFVFTIALATGMEVDGSGLDLFGLFGLAAIVNIAAILFATGMMMRFRTIQAAPLMQIPTFMILMTAPVYTPRSLLQGWVSTVAKVNPTTAVVEAARGLLIGQAVSLVLAFAATSAIAVGLGWFAKRGLRRAEANA